MSESLEQRARELAESRILSVRNTSRGYIGWDDLTTDISSDLAAFARSECGRLLEEAAREIMAMAKAEAEAGEGKPFFERGPHNTKYVALEWAAGKVRSLASGPPTDNPTEEREDV